MRTYEKVFVSPISESPIDRDLDSIVYYIRQFTIRYSDSRKQYKFDCLACYIFEYERDSNSGTLVDSKVESNKQER